MAKLREPSPDLKTVLRLALKSEDFRKELLRRRADAAKDLGLDLSVEEEWQLRSATELELEAMILRQAPPPDPKVMEELKKAHEVTIRFASGGVRPDRPTLGRASSSRRPKESEPPHIVEVLLRADNRRKLSRVARALRRVASDIDAPIEVKVVDEAAAPLSVRDVDIAGPGRLVLIVFARSVPEPVAARAEARRLTLFVSNDLDWLSSLFADHLRSRIVKRERPSGGGGLEELLRRAARSRSLRLKVLEGRSNAAAEAGVELSATERRTLDAIRQQQLALMIDTVAKGFGPLPDHDPEEPRVIVLGIRP